MTRAIRSELLKFFTTRLWWGMAIGMFLSAAAFAVLFGILFTDESAGAEAGLPVGDSIQIANTVYTAGLTVGYLLMLTIGVIQIGAEYRHSTITATFLTTPRRVTAMTAKVVALLLIAAVYGLISTVGSVAFGALTLDLRGADPFPSTEVLSTAALSLLVLGLWALVGLGIGILIPNQVAALLIGVGVAWIVEPLLGLALRAWEFGREHVVPYMPSEATAAIVNTVQAAPDDVRLSWWGASITLGLYAAVLAGVGTLLTVRRDVS
jgi:hypothetical protein